MQLVGVVILAVLAAAEDQEMDEVIQLEAGGKPYTFTSENYPFQPPDNFNQNWHFSTSPGSTIRVTCSDFRLVQKSETECTEETVTFTDGVKSEEVCGTRYGYTVLSSNNQMSVMFKTGMYGRGSFKCVAQGRQMDRYGEVTTTPLPNFREIPSQEIDSSEYGGPPGHKSTSCNCGWANKGQGRIVNGVETMVNEFPFMAALLDGYSRYQFCGGSILTEYHVLTAAHCTIKHYTYGKPITVAIGEHNLYYPHETNATAYHNVAVILVHPMYDARIFKNDISILVLETPISFSRLVGPVCLSPSRQPDISRSYVTAMGWGNLYYRGPSPAVLQKVHVRVVDMVSCNRVFRMVDHVSPTQICTYASNKATCQGDSGGPVVWLDPEINRYVQVGLVSFGTICADANPTVHTDVRAHYNWVQHVVTGYTPRETCSKVN
uniref:Venom S1 protease with CUB domain 2 n=1 Tax=Lethocerus distinctifemur TaxID=280095 RepID=A0A2K8JNE3_9HEMI|nr:venom S1 protease with CUB domain 2 [Lethocerus distinctifemur]